ncbi:dihydrofolate reductase [Halorubrum sp. CSM-61]|uniref:dihydrofolate reductase n=1 Tax=Halorubrum sp. CSM-61 TaxID=2485838 RepID=UPI000F4CE25D|nr:dihydrofolate reductase [Halorubrum sp. CSM-61]
MAGDASGSDAAGGADIDLVIVAAVAENGVIGDRGGMPWHYPADLAHFKRLTTGHPVIVGRATYESIADRIGGPLPDRTSVVLTTRDLDLPEGAVVAGDIEEAVDLAAADAADRGVAEVYVIGGATVYEQLLDRADRMVLTEVPERPDGDTRFPDWDAEAWTEAERAVADTGGGDRGGSAEAGDDDRDDDDADLAFVTYERADG